MTVEDIKKEMVRLQGMAKGIKLETGLLRADINKLEGCIKQDVEAADEAYQRGCKDAWDMAKRITLEPKDYKDSIPIDKLKEVFGTPYAYEVFQEYSYQEVVSKLNDNVEPEDEIYVGDIVRHKQHSGLEVYVFQVDKHLNMLTGMALCDSAGFCKGGAVCSELDNFVKTGRHHDFGKILEFLRS